MKSGIPKGALSGVFSVSATKKVYFSKGNLQLIGENVWQFANNQQEYFGDSQSDNHRDLFCWGTGNNPNLTYSTYDDDSTFNDWGTAAASSIGTGWRTLTISEWVYLFNTRTVNGGRGNGYSYTLGQNVNNVLGIVIYPDDYTGEVYTTAKSNNWSTFESAGCVFLPAAGYLDGPKMNTAGYQGFYWSSTPYDQLNSNILMFYSGNIGFRVTSNDIGSSVRLVYDITEGG